MPYTHLTPFERGQIEALRNEGRSLTEIGRRLGRHRTTIGREIARNRSSAGYKAHTAQKQYRARRKNCRPRRRLDYAPLRELIEQCIALKRWSPELAAAYVKRLYPNDMRVWVCHETIYRAIYENGNYLDYLRECLPQARRTRRARGQGKKRRCPAIPHRTPISQRDAIVEERGQIGHWEGDLVVGKNQDGFILTLVERCSRLLVAVALRTRRAHEACQAVIEALLDFPISWVRSITFDNGSEFADHQRIAAQLGVNVYFADPYSSYQRGSNEQVNGLLRRYLPKGTSFKSLIQEHLQTIVDETNNRPRKCLDYRTPIEVFQLQRQALIRALTV
jgi:transposase, IS30 family